MALRSMIKRALSSLGEKSQRYETTREKHRSADHRRADTDNHHHHHDHTSSASADHDHRHRHPYHHHHNHDTDAHDESAHEHVHEHHFVADESRHRQFPLPTTPSAPPLSTPASAPPLAHLFTAAADADADAEPAYYGGEDASVDPNVRVRDLEARLSALRLQNAAHAQAHNKLLTSADQRALEHALCVSELQEARNRVTELEQAAEAHQALRVDVANLEGKNAQLEAQLVEAVGRIIELEGASDSRSSSPVGAGDAATDDGSAAHSAASGAGGTGMCVVDLEPIRAGDAVFRLPCFHVHHSDCLLPYLREQDEPECPVCRTPVPPDDLDNLPMWTLE